MRVLFCIITAILVIFHHGEVRAMDIVAVSSSRIPPYMDALDGFRNFCGRAVPTSGQKTISFATITEMVLSESPDSATLRAKIRAQSPDLILAIGTSALRAVTPFKKTPILYLMVPYPKALVKGRANISGVDMIIDPAVQLDIFISRVPALKRLGIIYDPVKSGKLVGALRIPASHRNISLVTRKATSARQVYGLLDSMIGEVDALWMLPDQTVTTMETVEAMLLFSLQYRVPILSFTEKYVKRGAAMAVTFDNYGMGEKAGEMVREIADRGGASMPPAATAKVKVTINHSVASQLGLVVEQDDAEINKD